MTYRDDRDALRDQIRQLEERVADADREVALLRGDAPSPHVEHVRALRPLALDRIVARPLTEDRARQLERLWRARLPPGMRVERHGRAVTAASPGLTLAASDDGNGGSRLRMDEDVRPLRRVWTLIAISITLTLGAVAPLALRGPGTLMALAAVAATLALSAFPIGAWVAKRRRRELARIFEASAFVLSTDEARPNRVRVGEPDSGAAEAAAVEEAAQVEEQARKALRQG